LQATSLQHRPIRLLTPLVASQIAAGEVVERPASVVKELVENAVDAGATQITVDIEQGGIELVRVTDDGIGIPRDELTLALSPHATSKVEAAADLDHIATLGFRGEALASIASVSRLSIRSRPRSGVTDDPGESWQVDAEGLSIAQPRPTFGPIGTSVTVRNLFFSTPARRKFLRTVATEQERCIETLRQLSMAHPAIGFRVTCDGRTVVDLAPGQTPRERAVSILGKELGPQLLEVNADAFDDSRGIALWGLAGLPSIARGSAKGQMLFVNGRPIRDRTIQHAIVEAYRGLIEPGRYPTAVLMLEMSPAAVDVNVHPQKAEVRFRDSSLVHSVVLRALREALRRADLTPAASSLRPTLGGIGYAQPSAAGQFEAPAFGPGLSLPTELPGSGLPPQTPDARAISNFVDVLSRPQGSGQRGLSEMIQGPGTSGSGVTRSEPATNEPTLLSAPTPATSILQVHKSYLVTQDEQGVVIIDQHALHERVMFEYLLAKVASGPLEQQRLLMPAIVDATEAQVQALPDLASLLARLGIEATAAGPRQAAVHAFPSLLFSRGVDPVDFMGELLEKAEGGPLAAELKQSSEEAIRDVLDMMACKAAVKAGDGMSDVELAELVRLRSEVERSSNCPHGRPTSIRLSIKELERLFGRS
jgi:DNA mismatch repair protein MutL